ncbi:MAG: hypothetical protein Q4C44_02090 [bacterium]|nr:hypothetical protein [bacterium]
MNFKENEEFNNYVLMFKQLPKKEKEETLINILKENLVVVEKLLENKNINRDILYNREILDLKNVNYTDDDYLEAVFVYLHSFRELFASYIEVLEGGE